MNKERPLSPHLTIYRPQITSVLSIMHRMTGFGLFLGLIAILWTLNICSFKAANIQQIKGILVYITENKFFFAVMIMWSYCLFYHLCAGIRYLFWDAGKGMELRVVNFTGWLTIACSVIITYVFWHAIVFGDCYGF